MDLSRVAYEDLEDEIKKRDKERMGPWPKFFTFDVELAFDTKALDEFILGLGDWESSEDFYDQVYDSLDTFPKVTISIDEDGVAKVVEFDGVKLVKEEDNEEVISR